MDDEQAKPTPERLKKGGIAEPDRRKGEQVRVSLSPMEDCRRRGEVDQRQYDAAERLATDYYLGGLETRRALSLIQERVDCSQPGDLADGQYARRHAYAKAREAVGDQNGAILYAIVIEEVPLTEFGAQKYQSLRQARAWALGRLEPALDALAEHYGWGWRK